MSLLLIFSFLLLDFSVHSARAAMISTETAVATAAQQGNHDRVTSFLGRADVQQAMVEQGVDPSEALRRVDSLSDAEVARLAKTIDQLPAGAGGVGAVVGAAVLVFVILLVTDLLGLTHVFPFVNR